MDMPGFAPPIRAYRQNLGKMRESNDQDGSEVDFSFPTIGMVSKYVQRTIPGYTNGKYIDRFSGKRGMVRAGGSASRTVEDQSSTDPGGGGGSVGPSNGIPHGGCRRDVTKAATGRQIARNSQPWEGRRVQSGIQRNRTV